MTRWWGVADDGVAIEVTVSGDSTDSLSDRWPPMGLTRSDLPIGPVLRHLTVATRGPVGEATVTVDGEASPGGWDRVESELALFAAERVAGLVAVHAAVIVRETRALVVPGTSGSGKSTLCVAAVAAGAKVLTDEYALVDPITGRVTGWRRPVRVRLPGGGVDRRDLTVASDPLPVGLVALVAHKPFAKRSWAPISAAETVLGLLANTVCARSRSDEALDAALAIGRSARAVGGTRGEANEVIEELLALADE